MKSRNQLLTPMNRSLPSAISMLVIAVALFIVGFYSFDTIYEIGLLPKNNNLFYSVTDFSYPFTTALRFSIILSLIPIFIWITWRLSYITVIKQKLYSSFIVITCIVLALFFEQKLITSYVNELVNNLASDPDDLEVYFPYSCLNFEFYILAGLIIGCLVSFLLFRKKPKNLNI